MRGRRKAHKAAKRARKDALLRADILRAEKRRQKREALKERQRKFVSI